MTLPAEIQAELRRRQAELEAAGWATPLARQKVWQDYQAELVMLASTEASVAEIEPPELPPPKWRSNEDLARNGNKPWYRPRADSEQYWTPERKAKNQSELDKLKQQLGIRK